MHKETRHLGFVIRRIKTADKLNCMQHCVLEQQCVAVNINMKSSHCRLMGTILKSDNCTIRDVDWMYFGSTQVSIIQAVFLKNCRDNSFLECWKDVKKKY